MKKWKANPSATKGEIGVYSAWLTDDPRNNLPLSDEEVRRLKTFLHDHNPTVYESIFCETGDGSMTSSEGNP